MIAIVLMMHALLAVIFPIGRAATRICAPIFFTAVRMTLGGIILLGYYCFRYKKLSPKLIKVMGAIIGFTITGIYLTNVPEFWALQYVPAAKASFIYSFSPFAAALLSYFFFQERMTVKKLIGMGIGFIGFILMIIHHAPGEVDGFSIGFFSAAEGALIIAAVASPAGWIILRRKIRQNLCTTLEAVSISMILGGLLAFVHSLLTETWNPVPIVDYSHNIVPFIGYILLAVITSNLLGYTLYTKLLKKYTATFLSFAGFVEPLCAAFYAWIFLGETVTGYFFLSGAFVFIGLYIFYMEELRQGYVVSS